MRPIIADAPVEQKGSQIDAVMVVQPGGRVEWVNQRGREIFRLAPNEVPNLEKLSRRMRPSDQFLGLCAVEGQARLALEGRLAETNSYLLAVAPAPVMMVTLHFPDLAGGLASVEGGQTGQNLQTFTELTRSMIASLDLTAALQAVFSSVESVAPAEFMEITLWDAENETLAPFRYNGVAGAERRLEPVAARYKVNEGYSGHLAQERKALLVSNVEGRSDVRPAVDRSIMPLHSYMGVPLLAGDELVGTLELGSPSEDAFQQEDLNLLQLLAVPAAYALRNAQHFQQVDRRATELSGLSQLAQAFSSVRDIKSMYSRLIQSIVPLIPVNILGFLIYNEATRTLDAQEPFYGLPSQVLVLYKLAIPANSEAEHALLEQDLIVTENASEASEWEKMGFSGVAIGSGLRDTVLVPLSSGGRMMGYLQASNHLDGSSVFTQDELHLLMIIANQAAPIIENATLVQQTRQRAQRAEALRRIASLSSSAANLDEIIKFALQEISPLLRADMSAMFLVDRERGLLTLHRSSLAGALAGQAAEIESLDINDAQYHFTVSGTQRAFISGKILEEEAVIPYYRKIFNRLGLLSTVIVPLMVRNEGIGELWLGSQRENFFDQGDVQVMATAAGQLAGVVERSRLVAQTDESLRRQVEQLTALTRISRELSTSLDLNYLLQLVYDEALRTTRADCGTIMLFNLLEDPSGKPEPRFWVGDTPASELSEPELLTLTTGSVLNLPQAAGHLLGQVHEDIASLLVVPVRYQQRAAGLIILHSKTPANFDATAVDIAQSLAAQAAVALGNAIQFDEQARRGELLKRELDTMAKLMQVTQALRPGQPLDSALGAIGSAITAVTPFQTVLVSLLDAEAGVLRRVVGVGIADKTWQELRNRTQPWQGIQPLLTPEFKLGTAFYVPIDKKPAVPEDVHTVTVLPAGRKIVDAWDPKDFLLVPLYDAQGSPLGMISLDSPSDGRRPDRPTIEALDLFSTQASLMIENYHRATALESQLGHLQADQSRLRQSAAGAVNSLPLLLHRDAENALTLHSLNQQMTHLRAGLEMAALANRQPDSRAMMLVTASEFLTRFGMQTALLAEQTPAGPRLLDVVGLVPAGVNPEALFGQRNPLRQVVMEGKALFSANLETDSDWQNVPLLNTLGGRAFIALPFTAGEGRTAALLALSPKALPPFTEEQRQIYLQLARQVSVGMQNQELLTQTRRRLDEVNLLLEFTRHMGTLDPLSILRALVESGQSVISAADAGWVALFNDKTQRLEPQMALGYPENPAMLEIAYPTDTTTPALPMRVFKSGQPLLVPEIRFAQDYTLSSENLLRFRRATGGRLPISSLLTPISRGESILGVLVLDNFTLTGAFSEEDKTLALSLAQQTALALDNARLFVSAGQRAAQLQALTDVAGTITSSLQVGELTDLLLDQLKSVLPYETATLWLRTGEKVQVAAARGFADSESRLGLSAAVQDSQLFQEMVRTGQPILSPDVRKDERFPSLLEPEHLSWLGIPLVAKGELIGLMALEKHEADFYTSEHIQAARTFASQAAVALDNARLFEESQARAAELDQRSQRLGLLNRLSADLGGSLDMDYILKLTCQQMLTALNGSLVSAVMTSGKSGFSLQAEVPAGKEKLPQPLPEAPLLVRLAESQGIFTTLDVAGEAELGALRQSFFEPRQTASLLVVPLITAVTVHGWLLLQTLEEYHFSTAEIELARTIGNQAAIAIQNARLYAETRRLTEDLERRVEERTSELRREHNNTETLLRIITELSASLDMGQVLNRTLNVLNESVGAEQSLLILSSNPKSYQYSAGISLVTPPGDAKNRPEQEMARWVIRRRTSALVDDAGQDSRWKFPEDQPLPFKSVMVVPLVMGEDVLGGMLLFHSQPNQFMIEQVSMVEATARQISVSLNNAELFTLIRDQSEKLGGMLREQQIEASRSRAILEAVADGVLVTDGKGTITLFNASAQRILDLKPDQVIGQALDQFSGLFGKSSRTWMQTIRKWSNDPRSYAATESYAEQVNLDNGRVVAVHVSPVIWRSDYLGTVSIFRDITREVQVDRLKSEFVANVSHELRTPMTSIKGYVEIMLMGASGEITAQQKHFLEVVKSNAERLSVLVNDLLDVSRIESGRITLTVAPLNLAEIAQDAVADIQRRSQEENKPIEFVLDMAPDLPTVYGDLERIRQVVGNLVSNGYNYTPENGKVTLRAAVNGDEVQVDVKDTGIGIDSKDQKRIFERFYRGDDPLVLATAGTGLGLAMAKILVEMHQGRIWFNSSGVRGDGTTFSFTLPINRTEE